MAADRRSVRRSAAPPWSRALAYSLAASAAAAAGAQQPAEPKKPDDPATAAAAPTDSPTGTPSDFARFVTTPDGGHFDTAITTYRNEDGVEVRLFAAVHIADGACYRELEQRFSRCEALLYELVGPEDYRPKKGDDRSGWVSMLQQGLKNALELEFQLDGVDYSAPNFVHADMTPTEFHQSMEERGESLFGMLWAVGLQSMAAQAKAGDGAENGAAAPAGDLDLVRAFRSGEGRHQLRLMFASQLEGLESASAGGEGSTLLEGRNEKCLAVLKEQIAAGKKNLGIYYGAAHLPHMERRLCADLGFHKIGHEWLVAWDCSKRPDPKVDLELWRQRRSAKRDLEAIARAVGRWRDAHGGRVPTLEELGEPRDGRPYWSGPRQDPWHRDYVLQRYAREPGFDAVSFGQDGQADTDDDLHTASPRDLRRMRRDR